MLFLGNVDVYRNIGVYIFVVDIFLYYFVEICYYEIKEDSC